MMPHLQHLGDPTGKKPVEHVWHKKGSITISNVALEMVRKERLWFVVISLLSIVFFVLLKLFISE
jgi:hypothetical protein